MRWRAGSAATLRTAVHRSPGTLAGPDMTQRAGFRIVGWSTLCRECGAPSSAHRGNVHLCRCLASVNRASQQHPGYLTGSSGPEAWLGTRLPAARLGFEGSPSIRLRRRQGCRGCGGAGCPTRQAEDPFRAVSGGANLHQLRRSTFTPMRPRMGPARRWARSPCRNPAQPRRCPSQPATRRGPPAAMR
jgi:hypothetical protein